MEIPSSMKVDLARWNNGAGIDLEGWTSCLGNYGLAVGYLTLFWPEFEEFEGYILRKGFSIESLRAFEASTNNERKSVAWVMNHLHIGDIHMHDDAELSEDKLIILGNALKEIYQAKLAWQFPNEPCIVKVYIPGEGETLTEYQISFWQQRHEPVGA
jgi:hypothetical protein